MKIALLSDIHMEHGIRPEIKLNEDVDVLVMAGDIGYNVEAIDYVWTTFSTRCRHIVFVAGNHEYYRGVYQPVLAAMKAHASEFVNFHFLENEAIEIDGYHFIGATAWSDFRMCASRALAIHQGENWADYRAISWREGEKTRLFHPNDSLLMNSNSHTYIFSEIASRGRAKTIVVTHFAPSPNSISKAFQLSNSNFFYANTWTGDIDEFGPLLWLHGHTHSMFDYMIGNTRVLCNPMGYPGEFPNRILEAKIIDVP